MAHMLLTRPVPPAGQNCLFGGSFNPVHSGHIEMARFLLEHRLATSLDITVTGRPPHKSINDDNPLERLEMARLAFESELKAFSGHFTIDDSEVKSGQPTNYLIDTLARRTGQPPAIIIGLDSLLDFTTWKDWPAIIEHSPLWVFPRFRHTEDDDPRLPAAGSLQHPPAASPGQLCLDLSDFLQAAGIVLPAELMKYSAERLVLLNCFPRFISSRQLRSLIARGSDCRSEIPAVLHNHPTFTRRYGEMK